MYNLLETTRGKRVTTDHINKLINYLINYQDIHYVADNVIAVLGRDAMEKDLPKWNGVIPVKDKMFVDFSIYYDKNLREGLASDQLKHTAIFADKFKLPSDIPHSLLVGYTDIASTLIANSLLQFLILNNDEYLYVKAICEYHFKVMIEEIELGRAKVRAIRTVDMTQLGEEILELTEPDGTFDKLVLHINMLGNKLQRDKLSMITKDGVSVLVSKGWISKSASEDILTCFEHPPSMFAIVYAAYNSSLFKRSNITQILRNGKVVDKILTNHLENVLFGKD